MSDLVDAITATLTRRPVINEGSSLADILAELVHAAGTAAGAARMMGVASTTFYRWRNFATGKQQGIKQNPERGKNPHTKRAMVAAIRRAALKPEVERAIRDKRRTLKIAGLIKVSNGTRRRTIEVGPYLPASEVGAFLDYWLAGDDDAAEETLMEAIAVYYVEGMDFEQIDWAEFSAGGKTS